MIDYLRDVGLDVIKIFFGLCFDWLMSLVLEPFVLMIRDVVIQVILTRVKGIGSGEPIRV